jgi:hypothetical protein
MYSFVVFLLLLTPDSARAQNLPVGCDSDLIRKSRNLDEPYQVRLGNKYCDGSVPVENCGELRIVSLTLGKIAFTDEDSFLQVDRIATHYAGEVFLRGEDKRAGKSYRLDGSITAGGGLIRFDQQFPPAASERACLSRPSFCPCCANGLVAPITSPANSPRAHAKTFCAACIENNFSIMSSSGSA